MEFNRENLAILSANRVSLTLVRGVLFVISSCAILPYFE
jgi:hypothetical protein